MSIRKKTLFIAVAVILLFAVLGTAAKIKIDRVEGEALRLAETGKQVLDTLGDLGKRVKSGDPQEILAIYDESYQSPHDGLWRERLRSEHHGVRVYDWEVADPGPTTREDVPRQYAELLRGVEHLEKAKLKLAQVEAIPGPDEAVVRSVLWMRGEREGGRAFEAQATLRLHLLDRGSGYRITRQELLRGKTVTGSRQGFVDVAEEAGLDFVVHHNPKFDTPEWHPDRFAIIRYGLAGVTATDYDGDGWDDVFFADGASARLYRNQGDGTFEDVTAAAGLPTDLGGVNVALFADLDNDGDRDLFLGVFTGENRLYRNQGDGTFEDVTDGAGLGGRFVTVAAAGDADGDGLLDLYVGRYLDPRIHLPTTLFYARNGQGNSLLRNLGDLRFEDVTEHAGVREGGLTLGVTWADYDDDGDQDLYVANDFGRNALLENRGDGTFDDVSQDTGTLDFGYGMSATWNDVDNDGDLDLYTSNVHSGQRWYGQAPSLSKYLLTSLRQGTIYQDYGAYREVFGYAGSDWKDYGDRMVKGNSLLLNDGDGNFTDAAEDAGANPFGWYWGATFLDYDNDGWQDVYLANGWITAESHKDL